MEYGSETAGRLTVKIYLLSYAGGSSLSYISWKPYFIHCDLEILDYKGHGLRQNEIPDDSIESMAADIAEQIVKTAGNDHFIIFGHSMGGIIAWHAAWILISKYKICPDAICPSSCACPLDFSIRLPQSEYEIIDDLRKNGHASANMFQSKYFLQTVLPIIKHDYQKIFQYQFSGEVKKLSLPIYVFYGTEDELVPENKMTAWQKFSSTECRYFSFRGNHFYFEQDENKKKMCQILDSLDTL